MKKLGAVIALMTLIACGGGDSEGGGRPGGGRGGGGGGRPPWAGGQQAAAAVPVEVATVERKTIASYIETNGSLEAENEVDIVARLSAPIVGLLVEEGDYVQQGQTLARLDDTELAVQTERQPFIRSSVFVPGLFAYVIAVDPLIRGFTDG